MRVKCKLKTNKEIWNFQHKNKEIGIGGEVPLSFMQDTQISLTMMKAYNHCHYIMISNLYISLKP